MSGDRTGAGLEEAFRIKHDSLSGRIGHAEECLAAYASGTIGRFADIIRSEMRIYRAALEKARADFGRLGADTDGLRGESVPPRSAGRFSKIMDQLNYVDAAFYDSADMAIPFMDRWRHQRADGRIGRYHGLLSGCVSEMADAIGIGAPVLAVFGIEFSTMEMRRHDRTTAGHIVIVPESQRTSISRWSIAAHELGHAYYDLNRSRLEREVLDPVMKGIDKMGISDADDEDAARTATGYWVRELVSDRVGARTMGPVFAEAALEDAIGPAPHEFRRDTLTHPPWEMRMRLVRRTLREMDLESYRSERFEGTWDAYESAFARTEDCLYSLLRGGGLDDLAIDRICRAVTVEPAREAQGVEPSNAASRSALACLAACAAEGDPAKREDLEQAALDRYANT